MAVSDRTMGKELLEKVCNSIGADFSNVRRVILDIPFDGMIVAYVETLVSKQVVKIDWTGDLRTAMVSFADKEV